MTRQMDCDVLVVGGGPTGTTLGLLLARGGMKTIVVDKVEDIYPLPRAAHVDHEIMRIFQGLGVADQVAASCRTSERYDFLTASGEILLRFEDMDKIGPGGWPASNMIHQPSIEAILRAAGKKQTDFEFHTGWNWTSFRKEYNGVKSTIVTPEGEFLIRSRFLIGADGARSSVRTAVGTEMDDLAFDEEWLVVDALVTDFDRLPKVNLQICNPARPTTCVLMGSGRHRWEFMLKPGETAEELLDDERVSELLKPWNVDGAVTIERKVVYRFNAKVARDWRKGSVLLAGDAAHLMPPFAGQGLCSGMRDAANLAWKLIAVFRGAKEALLDTYQSEREAHVRPIIALAIMMGRTVCISDPAAATARDEQMLAARAAGAAPDGVMNNPVLGSGCTLEGSPEAGHYFPQMTTDGGARLDDALNSGAWLISKSQPQDLRQSDDLCLAKRDDDLLRPLWPQLQAWLDKYGVEAVLVRPDRYIFGTGKSDMLLSAWRATTFRS